MSITTIDIDSAKKARRAGYRIVQEPRKYDFGTEPFVADPDGYTMGFGVSASWQINSLSLATRKTNAIASLKRTASNGQTRVLLKADSVDVADPPEEAMLY